MDVAVDVVSGELEMTVHSSGMDEKPGRPCSGRTSNNFQIRLLLFLPYNSVFAVWSTHCGDWVIGAVGVKGSMILPTVNAPKLPRPEVCLGPMLDSELACRRAMKTNRSSQVCGKRSEGAGTPQ